MSNSVAARRASIALSAALVLALHSNAHAQTASLESRCDDIKMVFDIAGFIGDYKRRADIWIRGKCRGPTPLPEVNDPWNVQRFNTAAGILQNGGGISITE